VAEEPLESQFWLQNLIGLPCFNMHIAKRHSVWLAWTPKLVQDSPTRFYAFDEEGNVGRLTVKEYTQASLFKYMDMELWF
jgi:hypothetical protein